MNRINNEKIIKICNSIAWNPLYSNTLERLNFFIIEFKKIFPEVDDNELSKNIIYSLGKYGQDELYNIFCVIKKENNFNETFLNFKNAFDETLDFEVKWNHLIDLFFEYAWSVYIKQ